MLPVITSTGQRQRPKPRHMGWWYLGVLAGGTIVLQLLLRVSALERVSDVFGLAVILLGAIAALNWLAARYGWGYIWILPSWPRPLSPDICVAIGFVVGLGFGIWKWI
jgi:hypothetical protein